jgi:hypothetical protein
LEAIFLSRFIGSAVAKWCLMVALALTGQIRVNATNGKAQRSIRPLQLHPLFEMTLLVKDSKPRFDATSGKARGAAWNGSYGRWHK